MIIKQALLVIRGMQSIETVCIAAATNDLAAHQMETAATATWAFSRLPTMTMRNM
jgi:hypothetical protein